MVPSGQAATMTPGPGEPCLSSLRPIKIASHRTLPNEQKGLSATCMGPLIRVHMQQGCFKARVVRSSHVGHGCVTPAEHYFRQDCFHRPSQLVPEKRCCRRPRECFCLAALAFLVRLSAIAWQSFSTWRITLTRIHPHSCCWPSGRVASLSLSLSLPLNAQCGKSEPAHPPVMRQTKPAALLKWQQMWPHAQPSNVYNCAVLIGTSEYSGYS